MNAGGASNQPRNKSENQTSQRWKIPALLAVIVLGAGAFLLMRGGASDSNTDNDSKRLNVLLITMDTTRADHLGCYGHPSHVTPNIDLIAQQGAVFEQCMASAPSTFPSHSSIMTGLYQYVHGARDNIGYRLSESNVTLAETLQEKGYATGAFVSAAPLERRSGIGQGFQTYEDSGDDTELIGAQTSDRAIRWLRNHATERFFAWVHFYDPHFPYEAPADFISSAPNAYLREIAYMDAQIGRITTELKRLNSYDNTIIVLVADHGEGLGQHNEKTHLYFIYNTTIHVPFILRAPNLVQSNRRIQTLVRTIDIAPTILELLDMKLPPVCQGTGLEALATGNKQDLRLSAYSETIAGNQTLGASILRSISTGQYKYIHAPRPELYDLAVDPGEINNLAEERAEQVTTMREAMRGLIAESPEIEDLGDETIKLDAQDLARLESLGYVGGDLKSLPPSESELDLFEPDGPDPKDFADEFSVLSEAQHLLLDRKFREAEDSFRRLAKQFPDVIDLKKKLARAVFNQDRFDEAIQIYDEICNEHPDEVGVRYGYGKLLDKVGRRKDAIKQFIATIQLDPEHPEACHDLGIALREEGHIPEAIRYLQQAVRARPSYIRAHVNLARIHLEQQEFDEAISSFRAAADVSPEDPELRASVAFALLRAGRYDSAAIEANAALALDASYKPAQRILGEIKKASSGRP